MIDGARPPRAGEELPIDRLTAYLGDKLGGGPVSVAQFPGGHSNLTYLITVGGRDYVLRRPPFGSKVKTAHDMGREVRVLSHLAPVWPLAPRPVLFCEDESVLGAKFYIMERIRGIIVRRELPAELAPHARRLSESLVDTLVALHAIDWRAAGLDGFGNPDGYVERQVTGWTKRWQDARTDDIPEVDEVAAWLAARLPPSGPPAIVHNDFKLDNLVLDEADPTRIVGILDWEMATLGDPLADLGTALCYWVEAADPPELVAMRFGPTGAPGMMTRAEIAARYAEKSGRSVERIGYYYVLGLFKTAVVAQQIYKRWKDGLTKDDRFAQMILGVRAMARQAARTCAGPV
jgi:aminoglycoside phosphotransferase (APT) family kinase protein